MNIKKSAPIDALQLAKKLKNLKDDNDSVSKFEEFFSFSFKITVSMKKILQDILKMKEFSYKFNSYNKKNLEEFNKPIEIEVDDFKLLNIKSVKLGYDKYTIFSKKDFFYVIEFEHVATISQFLQTSTLSLVDDEYYDSIVKLSKNINEYYETEVLISGDRKEKIEKIIVKKNEFDLLDKKAYFESNNTFIFVDDVLKNFTETDKPLRVHYWSDYSGY